MGEELSKERKIDISVERTLQAVSSGYKVRPNMEIRAWKAYLAVTFVAGFSAALIWGSYMSVYQTSKAGSDEVTLSTSAVVASHKVGDEFPIQILLNTAGKNIVAAQAIFNFDKNAVRVVSMDTSASGFNYEIKNSIDASAGQGFLALAKPTPGANGTSVKIATVNLKALSDVSEPTLRLKLDTFNAVSDSAAILDDGRGTNVLQKLASIFPVGTPPSSPPVQQGEFSIVSQVSLADTIVKLDWSDGPSKSSNYIIERKTGKDAFSSVSEVDSARRSFADRGLKPNTAYVWRVCQQSGGGKNCTGEKTLRTLKKKGIFKPNLRASVENGKVNLSWSPSYAADFKVILQRKVGKAKKFATLSVISSDTQNSYLDETVVPGTAYVYQMIVQASKKSSQTTKQIKITVP